MYRWLLQLSPGTGCKYPLLFFSMLVQFAPIPFWNMVVNMNALLGKAECFCDCSIIFILFFSLYGLFNFVFFIICVCDCMFVLRGETHRHCTGWLFSWFIIINHCNDSFIPLVLTFVSGKICVAIFSASYFDNYPLGLLPSGKKQKSLCCRKILVRIVIGVNLKVHSRQTTSYFVEHVPLLAITRSHTWEDIAYFQLAVGEGVKVGSLHTCWKPSCSGFPVLSSKSWAVKSVSSSSRSKYTSLIKCGLHIFIMSHMMCCSAKFTSFLWVHIC